MTSDMSGLAELSGDDAFTYDGLEQQAEHLVADGKPLSLGVLEFKLRFPGQYFDKETGLAYSNFRDYEPQTGPLDDAALHPGHEQRPTGDAQPDSSAGARPVCRLR
jgi:RHS repeat-associated protein